MSKFIRKLGEVRVAVQLKPSVQVDLSVVFLRATAFCVCMRMCVYSYGRMCLFAYS